MREDSAEETLRPTTVLALVKAPLAAQALESGGGTVELGEEGGLASKAWEETLEPLELADEVLLCFFEPVAVVMVVFPVVEGNLTLVVLGLEDMLSSPKKKLASQIGRSSYKLSSCGNIY